MNNVLELYVLYASDPGDTFFFMVYKFNEASGEYEFSERMPVSSLSSIDSQYHFVDASDVFDYAQNTYNNLHGIKAAPETGDGILYYLLALSGAAAVIFLKVKRIKHSI